MKIACLASSALVLSSLATPAFATTPTASGATISAMQTQCAALDAQKSPAFTVVLDQNSISGAATGLAADDGSPYSVGGQQGQGEPQLSNIRATGITGHTNGGSQNIFTTGEATASWAAYTFNGIIATITPYEFSFSCSVTEAVTVPGETENKGQCVSRIQNAGSTRSAAEEFCDDPANRQTTVGGTTDVPHLSEAGIPVPQPVGGTRTISGELNTAYASLASVPLVVQNHPVANVLACNSPDNFQPWVNRNGSELVGFNCASEGTRLGLTPVSGKRK
jgi:hypothetical protein